MTHYDNFETYIQENNQEKLLHYIETLSNNVGCR